MTAGRGRRAAAAKWLRRDTGASALELTFVGPALLLLIFVSVQAGLFFYGRAVAIQAAREGVSQLRLVQDEDLVTPELMAELEGHVEGYAAQVGSSSLLEPKAEFVYDAGDPDDPASGQVRATVSGKVITLVPFLDLTTQQSAVGRIEKFQAPQ